MPRPMTLAATTALTLMACAHSPELQESASPDPGGATPTAELDYADWQANTAAEQQSATRLAELEVLEFGELIVDAPAGSQNCYGPCPDDPTAQAWMQEHARQVDRLAAFVETAEALHAETLQHDLSAGNGYDPAEVEADLEVLRGLEIIEIVGVDYDAGDNGNCYRTVCPGDDARRAVVDGLASMAPDL